MKIDVFTPGPMETYARLISSQLGVRVIMRGREVCVRMDQVPPTIYLPNMEDASPKTVDILFGFCLHEAGHVRYTKPDTQEEITDYLVHMVHNALEDERIERFLERDFPGAREILKASYLHGCEILAKDGKKFMKPTQDKSYLKMSDRDLAKMLNDKDLVLASGMNPAEIRESMDRGGASFLDNVRKRLEIFRTCCLWIVEKRRYDMPLYDWPTHPWKAVFDEVTSTPARTTAQALEQARLLIEKLGIKTIKGDERPIEKAKELADKALEKMAESREATRKMEHEALRKVDETARRIEESDAKADLSDAINKTMDEKHEAREAKEKRRDAHAKYDDARDAASTTRKRLDKEEKRLGELKEELTKEKEKEAEEPAKAAESKPTEPEKTEESAEGTPPQPSPSEEDASEDEAGEGDAGDEEDADEAEEVETEAEDADGEENKEAEASAPSMGAMGETGDGKGTEAEDKGEAPGETPGESATTPMAGPGSEAAAGTGEGSAPAEGTTTGTGGAETTPPPPPMSTKEMLEKMVSRMEDRVRADKELLAARESIIKTIKEGWEKARKEAKAAMEKVTGAEAKEAEKRKAFEKATREITDKVADEFAVIMRKLEQQAKAKEAEAKKAADEANEVLGEMHERDGNVEAQITPHGMETIIEEQFEEYRDETLDEELDGIEGGSDVASDSRKSPKRKKGYHGRAAEAFEARKYTPYTREYDVEVKIDTNNEAVEKYDEVRRENKKIIDTSAEKIRKLHSPEKNRVNVNKIAGRFDPRQAVNVRLAQMGHSVDLTRVWKDIERRRDPKVAVSLLIDCSGSMLSCIDEDEDGKSLTRLDLALTSACCLAEVMKTLGIPHEIIGHTTTSDGLGDMLKTCPPGDMKCFSRFIPFKGLVFKAFNDDHVPTSMFAKKQDNDLVYSCEDNLDGEAVLWAISRLAARKERTKICVVISDGLPCASTANTAELDRHLMTVCRKVEKYEQHGLFLFGIGVGEERVKDFYRNASVIETAEDLPKSVLGIVEHVLFNIVGSLG